MSSSSSSSTSSVSAKSSSSSSSKHSAPAKAASKKSSASSKSNSGNAVAATIAAASITPAIHHGSDKSHSKKSLSEEEFQLKSTTRLKIKLNNKWPGISVIPFLRPPKPDAIPQASVPSGIINMANTILGAGMLGTPYMVSSSGLVVGFILLAFFGFNSVVSCFLLCDAGERMYEDGIKPTFFSCSERMLKHSRRIIDFAIYFMCFGTDIAYLVVIGDLMPGAIGYIAGCPDPQWLWERTFWVPLMMLPLGILAFFKNLDALRYVSVGAIISVIYLLSLVITFTAKGPNQPMDELLMAPNDMVFFFSNLPTAVFAYCCQQNFFNCMTEFKTNRAKKTNISTSVAVSIAGSVYIIIAMCGYVYAGADVASNIILSYPMEGHPEVIAGRLFLCFLVGFSYPILLLPGRNSFDSCFFASCLDFYPTWRYIIETLFLLLTTLIFALFVTRLDVVLNITGAIGSTLVAYILPGFIYFRVFKDDGWTPKRIVSLVLGSFGLVFSIFSMVVIILQQVSLGNEVETVESSNLNDSSSLSYNLVVCW